MFQGLRTPLKKLQKNSERVEKHNLTVDTSVSAVAYHFNNLRSYKLASPLEDVFNFLQGTVEGRRM